uniref:Uncharacterized protein n=1 Tax=Arundo donax TaxID=35708 RepID=A0A0A9FDA5_ARUDO
MINYKFIIVFTLPMNDTLTVQQEKHNLESVPTATITYWYAGF